MKPKIIIVDEEDNIIGYKDRETIKLEEIYRVSALWITNSRGEILLAKRALTKSRNPGQWGTAVAGTVEEGEDYLVNIIKEAGEEIGLENINPLMGPKVRLSWKYNFFCQWYTLVVDREISEFVIDQEEVAGIRWISKDALQEEVRAHPIEFSKSMQRYIEMFCR